MTAQLKTETKTQVMVLLLMDNVTVVTYIKKMGAPGPPFRQVLPLNCGLDAFNAKTA